MDLKEFKIKEVELVLAGYKLTSQGHCPVGPSYHHQYGPCHSESSNTPVSLANICVIPCKNHLKIYQDSFWKEVVL